MTQTFNWKKLLPHMVAVALFLLIAVVYCRPVFLHKVLSQSDMAGWMGMVHQMQQYKAVHGHFPLWNNSMFGGMPGYQIALESQYAVSLVIFHDLLTFFLPAPASFFFLLCIAFYFLSQVLRIHPWIGILGGLAYGYASFNAILVSAGHETEIQAMGYVPFLLGALLLLYERKYWWGTTLTALFTCLLISRNHPQISYYFMIVAAAVTISYIVRWIREGQYKHMVLACTLAAIAGVLGILSNATSLFTTFEYSTETIRNGGLVMNATSDNGKTGHGLPLDYAFQWSYGIAETYTLLVPNIYGGSSTDLGKGSRLAKTLKQDNMPAWESDQFFAAFNAYWGDQPDTSGPVYLGAVVCFLGLFACVYLKNKHKGWLMALTILAILMAWGRHFAVFNDFLFYNLPFYNKFRVPSMTMFIPQLTVPLLVTLSLQQLFYGKDAKEIIARKFNIALGITGVVLVAAVGLYATLNYQSAKDLHREQYLTLINKVDPVVGNHLLQAAQEDRQALFGADLLRSGLFMAAAALLIVLYTRRKIAPQWIMAGLGFLVFADLMGVDTRYLSYSSYMNPDDSDSNITPSLADEQISRDTSYYRVLNLSDGPNAAFQESETSYFHNSLGGYHPAKLALIEDLITYQLSTEPINQAVLNMFNTKYVIVPHPVSPVSFIHEDGQGPEPDVIQNPNAMGPCWFVPHLHWVQNPSEAMKSLDHFDPRDSAIVEAAFEDRVPLTPGYSRGDSITLVKNDNDLITYTSFSKTRAFAVFSEIYYPMGWKAYVDTAEVPIIRVDYALRGLSIPSGKHVIRFEFKPASFYTGEKVAAISTWLMLLLILGTLVREIREISRKRKALNLASLDKFPPGIGPNVV